MALGPCSLGERLQDPPEKGEFDIFCRTSEFRLYQYPSLFNRTSVYLSWLCQNCWIENSSAEVSFNSLSSVEYFPFHVSKLIISRIKSCFVRRKGGLTWLFFVASPLCGAAGEGIHQRVFVSLTFVGRRAP